MNDIADAKASFAAQAAIFKRKHNWLMCVLYLGTFGSFIGYAAGFPLLIKSQFPDVNPLAYAWLGPLVGRGDSSLWWLAGRQARRCPRHAVELHRHGHRRGGRHGVPAIGLAIEGQFGGFFVCFLVLFLTTGIGNGSTFRMIPVIFLTEAMRGVDKNNAAAVAQANKEGNTLGAATLGFTGCRWLPTAGSSFPRAMAARSRHRRPPCWRCGASSPSTSCALSSPGGTTRRKHAEMPC